MSADYMRPLGAVPQRAPGTTIAQTRKRCPGCKLMIQPGDVAVWVKDTETRGVFHGLSHLWHPGCAKERTLEIEAARLDALYASAGEMPSPLRDEESLDYFNHFIAGDR